MREEIRCDVDENMRPNAENGEFLCFLLLFSCFTFTHLKPKAMHKQCVGFLWH